MILKNKKAYISLIKLIFSTLATMCESLTNKKSQAPKRPQSCISKEINTPIDLQLLEL